MQLAMSIISKVMNSISYASVSSSSVVKAFN